ncbi:Spo0E family sporulation regulatory protein-aspartic acid phosphatase [Salimicrobium halophilum]|uniref:Spo0E family sporulation regulatory protein-aspartic acid phosphatase n=1 Tax=Salimicrobium halophilum TaxID=86666 RepID=UPI000B8A5D92|nr:Spo0E family sporulation regulatory protein-aspartic acid phosphatase [Salimicrobium halophilum]
MTDEHADLSKLSNEELEKTIQQLKNRMVDFGTTYGLNHQDTIHTSQTLDRYVMEVQRRKRK